jgi:dTDP-4-dehydrorhamnose reductase
MPARPPQRGLEIWAGLECTVNRTSNGYLNQNTLNGHDERALDDLNAFASLGISRIRYPVLWETTAPTSPDQLSFDRSDERLARLRELGVNPIVGLLHHGSGPEYTSLVDPWFPERLADYARRVAERYPWVDAYTPVNEPLTTARFSGLYGVWYPHGRNDRTFVRALYNEVAGTVLAMRAIRQVNPSAQLVQTDDIGRASGTPPLRYQVDFENHRRWLTMDLLMGLVTAEHPLYSYLRTEGGLGEGELAWLVDNPCPPDVIGINHYPLSNRFLDHRVELYPEWLHGGNGRDRYADVGAVDTGQVDPPPPESVLREVWQRYGCPFAVTEAHIAGGREAQMRWLHELWTAALRLRAEGAPLVAVTAWSLLGAFGWNTLCTTWGREPRYESGVFDLRWSSMPQPTALATMIRSLATEGEYRHPLLERPGYWHEPSRVLFAPAVPPEPAPPLASRPLRSRPILILGAGDQLGRAFSRVCELRGIDRVLLSHMDLTSTGNVEARLADLNPWAVIDATRRLRLDDAEAEPERSWLENAIGTQNLAAACAKRGVQFVTFSSGFVFDGTASTPYRESHPVSPLGNYGKVKAEAERRVLEVHPGALIVRTGAFFGPWDWNGFMNLTLRDLQAGVAVLAADDVTVSPTYVPDLVWACLDLLADQVGGLIHLTNKGAVSWAEWARCAADLIGVDSSQVVACSLDDFEFAAPRPRYRVLESERADLLPSFDDAVQRFSHEMRPKEMT